jgi:6-phosphofructo-2-kinase/fructose-2,6-biphosphatase 2
MELPNQHSVPALKISQDLLLVSGVLQDMKDYMMLQPASPGIPPAAFGAGGSM